MRSFGESVDSVDPPRDAVASVGSSLDPVGSLESSFDPVDSLDPSRVAVSSRVEISCRGMVRNGQK